MDRKIRKQIIAWSVCLCVLLAVEVGLRMRLGKGELVFLSRTGFRHQTEFDRQTAALQMAGARNREVFIIGDSTMGVGFDTDRFNEMPLNPGVRARNLAYGGMSWETRFAAVRSIPVGERDDKLLVTGTAYFSVTIPMSEAEALQAAFVADGTGANEIFCEGISRDRGALENRLRYTLARGSRLYAGSIELRKFARHLFCYPAWHAPKFEPWTTPVFCDWSLAPGQSLADAELDPRPNFHPEGRSAFLLKKIVAMAGEKGLRVLIVNMPVTKREMERISDEDYKRYIAFLSGLAGRDERIQFVDMNRRQIEEEGNFSDHVHLNLEGQEIFTQMLGAHILRTLNNRPDSTLQITKALSGLFR